MPTPYKPIQTNGKKVQHLNGRPSKYNWRSHTKMLFGFSQRLVFGLFTASLYIYRNVGERGKTCRKGPSQSRSRATASGPQPIWYALYPMIPLHVVLLVHHCSFHCPDKCVCVCVKQERSQRLTGNGPSRNRTQGTPTENFKRGVFQHHSLHDKHTNLR